MNHELAERALDARFTFQLRPTPLPCDLRPIWRIALLVLIVDHCRGGRASVEQIHVLNWSIRTKEARTLFLEFLAGNKEPNQVIIRYDPSLSRAMDFALGEGVLTRSQPTDTNEAAAPPYRILLTSKGKALAKDLMSADDIMVEEKQFLAAIGGKISQAQITDLFRGT